MTLQKLSHAATARTVAVAVMFSLACARDVPRSHVVTLSDLAFQPAELTVSRGDTIVWNNTDFLPHTATARDGSWDSKMIAAGGSWRMVADKSGRQTYYCSFHPMMVGTIVVR